jgi:hypothetical protein
MVLLCPRWGINTKVSRVVTLCGLMDWWNVSEEPSTQQKEAAGPLETLLPIYQTTRHHIPEDTHI